MTEPRPAIATSDLGVVDPMRIPGSATLRRAWRALPILARVFVALAGVDVAARALGLFGTGLYLHLEYPLTWFTAFFPHDALILLPALIVARRPDALDSMPLVVRGAVAVAAVELLSAPAGNLVSIGNAPDPVVAPTVISIVAQLVTAGGWLWLAQGLRALNQAKPTESIAGLANLVAGALAIAALANLALALFGPQPDVGEPTWTTLLQLNNAVLAVPALAFAYLAGSTVLGTGDQTRPYAARQLAMGALVLLAIGSLVMFAVGQGAVWVLIGFATGPLPMTAFLVAFGLGLADPSGTIEPAVQTQQPLPA